MPFHCVVSFIVLEAQVPLLCSSQSRVGYSYFKEVDIQLKCHDMAFSQSACAWLHHEIAPLSKCLYNRHHLQGKGCSPSPLKPLDVSEQCWKCSLAVWEQLMSLKCPLMLTMVFTNFLFLHF